MNEFSESATASSSENQYVSDLRKALDELKQKLRDDSSKYHSVTRNLNRRLNEEYKRAQAAHKEWLRERNPELKKSKEQKYKEMQAKYVESARDVEEKHKNNEALFQRRQIDYQYRIEELTKKIAADNSDDSAEGQIHEGDLSKHYAALGVSSDVTDEELKRSFRERAKLYHPDVSEILDAKTKFKEINEAYDKIAKARGIK